MAESKGKGDKGKGKGKFGKGGKGDGGKSSPFMPTKNQWGQFYPGPSKPQWMNWWPSQQGGAPKALGNGSPMMTPLNMLMSPGSVYFFEEKRKGVKPADLDGVRGGLALPAEEPRPGETPLATSQIHKNKKMPRVKE